MEAKKFQEILKNHIKKCGKTQKSLAEEIGMTQPQVNNLISCREGFGAKNTPKFATALNIDPIWLMTQGEQGTAPTDPGSETPTIVDNDTDIINIPVLNLDVRGGLAYNNAVDIEQYTTSTMPFSRSIACEGDVVVPVFGDSMSPRYPSGSHILIRPLPLWREWLELGQSYVLELGDYRRTIKIVRKGSSNEFYRLECYNVDYDSTEIPKKMIEHVFQVLAVFKRETM